jgi:hypothetical protein
MKTEPKTARLAFRLSITLYKNLLKLAKKHKEKPSDTIRKALAFYLAQN